MLGMELEQDLIALWQNKTRIKISSMNDDLTAMISDSLLLAEALSSVADRYGTKVPVHLLLQGSFNIMSLAAWIRQQTQNRQLPS